MALTCEKHTAALYERGGSRKIGDLKDLERVKWERKRDDISHATVYIGSPGIECQQTLQLAETNRVELVIFRGDERVWEGPITRISYHGWSVEVEARDVMVYVQRTIMRREYDNRYPRNVLVLDRIKRIMTAELARKEALDPPINVLAHAQFLTVHGSTTYKKSYYDIAPIRAGISGADSIADMEAAVDGIQAEYGLALNIGAPPGTNGYGMTWLPAQYQDWQLRQYFIAAAEALSKYPAGFIRDAGIEGMYFVKDLQTGSNFNVGGAAVDTRLYLDISDYSDSGSFDSEHITHHELNHLLLNRYGAGLILTRWAALNPAGFQYGPNWQSPGGVRPAGFIRDYGRYSFAEDLAEVAGALMSASMRPYLNSVVAADPIVAGKVELFKEWMASISGGLVAGDEYYRALVEGNITTPGENGAIDAGTAARTLPYQMTLFEHIDSYAARGGIDYTVIGRAILFFDVHTRIGQTPQVTADDFIGNPVITQYGMELATYVAHTDGEGNWGDAGGVDPYYGEWEVLHQAYDEDARNADNPEEPPSVAELKSQAQRTYAQGSKPPLVVRIPDNTRLNPNGVLKIADLVPGVWIPLSAKLPGREVSQMQKLDSMTVEETADEGESIKVTLSPAYAQSYVDEGEA